MLAKKNAVLVFPHPNSQRYRKELKDLYARHVAITSVIASLEAYDRFRAKRVVTRTQKTA